MNYLNNNRYFSIVVLFALFVGLSFSMGLAKSYAQDDPSDIPKDANQEGNLYQLSQLKYDSADDFDKTVVQPEELIQQELAMPFQTQQEAGINEQPAPDKDNKSELATRLFQIKNLNIGEIKEKVSGLLTKEGQLGASVEVFTFRRSGKEINALVVRDTPEKIQEISLVLEELEKEFAPLTVSLNFDDVSLSQILTTIARMTGMNIIGGEAVSQKISVHLKDIPIEDVFDILLKRTGYTYIKDGDIVQIFSEEDVPFISEVFELEHVSAEEVQQAISHLVSKGGNVKSFSKYTKGKFSNFLVVSDTREQIGIIRELVKKLDKKRRQVMIEVKFCEVTLDKEDKLGIDWIITGALTGAKGPTTFPFNDNASNILRPPHTVTGMTGAFTMGSISFSDFKATLHARNTKTTVNLIASPRVAAMEGEQAQIVIGDVVPIPLYERNAESNTMEISGYEDEDIGTLLKVTPVVNSDNTVTLWVNPEVSEITGYTGPNDERPILSTRKIETVFTVESGKTIVLGGLKKQTLTKTVNKVPLLGSLPFVGRIFSYNSDVDDTTELLIFITPYILDYS